MGKVINFIWMDINKNNINNRLIIIIKVIVGIIANWEAIAVFIIIRVLIIRVHCVNS